MKRIFVFLLIFYSIISGNYLNAQITYLNSLNSHSDEAIQMIISPDNKFSYVVSTHEVQTYQRDLQTGQLTFLSSLSQMPDGTQFYNISSLAMSTDTRFIYVIGSFKVFVFKRDSVSGLLTPFQKLSDGNHQSLYPGNNNIAVSKDSKNVYVAGGKHIYTYKRNALSDSLSLLDTLQNVNGNLGLGFDISILLSSDDSLLFATGGLSISVYSRDPATGLLAFKSIITGTNNENQGLSYSYESVSCMQDKYIYTVTNSMGSGALVALKRDTVTDSLTIIQTIYNSIRPRYINRSWDNKLLCITGFDNFANATTLMFYEINNVTGMLIYLSTFQGGSRYDCKKCIDWNNRYMYTCPYFTDSIYIHQFDPFIDQELYVCNGESATLEAWGNYTSYLWSTGSTSPSITVNVPGNYYLTVQEANGNIYTDTVSVHIDSIPPVILGSDTTLYPGEYLFLDAGMNYTSYYWNVDNSTSQYMFLQNDSTFFGTTVVAVEVSNSNGCIAYDTILVTFSQGPNGIQTAGKTTISVYPNPFTSQAIINTGDLTGEMTLTIFDLSGQIVQETNYKNAKTIVISRNDLLSGLYFIRLKNDRNTFVSKLIVTDN